MALEHIANLGATSLAASYTAGAGSITVSSTVGSPAFSTSPVFRVAVCDHSTGAVKVILKVTAITDGTHFAVTAEGADANASSTDDVFEVLTAGGLRQLLTDLQGVGTWSSRPTTSKGYPNRYQCTDCTVEIIDDGSALYYKCGSLYLPGLPLPTLSWVNQGSGNVSTIGAFEQIGNWGSANTSLSTRGLAAPVGDFTFRCILKAQDVTGGNVGRSGVFLYDSGSGQYYTWSITTENYLRVEFWNNNNSLNSQPLTNTLVGMIPTDMIGMQWRQSGSNFVAGLSWDAGNMWSDYWLFGRPWAPTHVGYFARNPDNNCIAQLRSWELF